MYYIPQLSNSSCGVACVKMLLAIVHKDEGYLYLNEDENHGQYSYQDLVILAQRYDVTLMGVQYDDKDDLRHLTSFPVILTVVYPNETVHALLISKRKGNRVKVHDPAKGIYWLKLNQLLPIWDGTLLSVNAFERKPYPHFVIDTKDYKGTIVSALFQTLTALFIGLATFFMKPGGGFLYPILFIAGSLISEILLRYVLLKRMQRYDRYIRRFLPYVRNRNFFEFYKRSQEYKKCSLSIGLNLVFSALIVILICTISLINSLNYLILIIASLLGAYRDAFFFTPYKNVIAKDVAQEENDLRTTNDADGVELKVKTMELKSYRYAYLEFAKKAVVGFFMLAASVILCLIERNFSIANVIFHMCLSVLLYQSLAPIFSYETRVEENLLSKARINNVVHLDEINRKNH